MKIEECRSWWRPDVYQAFLRTRLTQGVAQAA